MNSRILSGCTFGSNLIRTTLRLWLVSFGYEGEFGSIEIIHECLFILVQQSEALIASARLKSRFASQVWSKSVMPFSCLHGLEPGFVSDPSRLGPSFASMSRCRKRLAGTQRINPTPLSAENFRFQRLEAIKF